MRRGFGTAVVLIGIGVFALLVDLDIIPAAAWRNVLGLWPLLLVVIGIDLLLARRLPLAALGLSALMVAGGLYYAAAAAPEPLGPSVSQLEVPREGAQRHELSISFGGGELQLRGGAGGLVELSSPRANVTHSVSRMGELTRVRLEPSSAAHFVGGPFQWDGLRWQVQVAGDIPTELSLSGGAGELTLDLREVDIRDLRISTGAAQITLRLGMATGEVPVRISTGASSVVIELSPGTQARVDASGAALSVDGPRETEGYATATDRFTISLSAAASSVTIRQAR